MSKMNKNEVKEVINIISGNWNSIKGNSRECRYYSGGDFTCGNAPDWSVAIYAKFKMEDVFTKEDIVNYGNEVRKYDSNHYCSKAGLVKFIKGLMKRGLRIECYEGVEDDAYGTWYFTIEIYND